MFDGCGWGGLAPDRSPASAGASVVGVGPLPSHARRTSVRRCVAVQLCGRQRAGPDARGQRRRNSAGGRPLGLPSDAGQGRLRGELRRTSGRRDDARRFWTDASEGRAGLDTSGRRVRPRDGLTTRGCADAECTAGQARRSRRPEPRRRTSAPELIRGWPARFNGARHCRRSQPHGGAPGEGPGRRAEMGPCAGWRPASRRSASAPGWLVPSLAVWRAAWWRAAVAGAGVACGVAVPGWRAVVARAGVARCPRVARGRGGAVAAVARWRGGPSARGPATPCSGGRCLGWRCRGWVVLRRWWCARGGAARVVRRVMVRGGCAAVGRSAGRAHRGRAFGAVREYRLGLARLRALVSTWGVRPRPDRRGTGSDSDCAVRRWRPGAARCGRRQAAVDGVECRAGWDHWRGESQAAERCADLPTPRRASARLEWLVRGRPARRTARVVATQLSGVAWGMIDAALGCAAGRSGMAGVSCPLCRQTVPSWAFLGKWIGSGVEGWTFAMRCLSVSVRDGGFGGWVTGAALWAQCRPCGRSRRRVPCGT